MIIINIDFANFCIIIKQFYFYFSITPLLLKLHYLTNLIQDLKSYKLSHADSIPITITVRFSQANIVFHYPQVKTTTFLALG
jgi:predicted membrane chloride channel (bestrophin family)